MKKDEHRTIRLLIANDQPVIYEGLQHLLAKQADIALLGTATTLPATFRMVGELEPTVLLIDPHMRGWDGMRAIELIRGEWPQTAIVIFTTNHSEDSLLRVLHAGVSGYLTHHVSSDVLLHTIRTAARHEILLQQEHIAQLLAHLNRTVHTQPLAYEQPGKGCALTGREKEILQRVAYGERNKEIAMQLGISEPTVKTHLANIFFKLGVDSRASAVALAIEQKIILLQKKPEPHFSLGEESAKRRKNSLK